MSEMMELVESLRQDNELLDAEVKRQSEALRFGSTEFVKNERADELDRQLEVMSRVRAELRDEVGRLERRVKELEAVEKKLDEFKKANVAFSEVEVNLNRELIQAKTRVSELEESNATLRGAFETLDRIPENLRHTLAKREEYIERLEHRVGQLEDREGKLNDAVALWKGKVDRGETWESFETKVVELLNAEGRVALKRLAAFMRWSLKMTRRVNELEEKNLELDLEAEHLASVIDATNATMNGTTPEEFEKTWEGDDVEA